MFGISGKMNPLFPLIYSIFIEINVLYNLTNVTIDYFERCDSNNDTKI